MFHIMPKRIGAARGLSAELSKRERQIMDVVYRLGQATAAEAEALLEDRPGLDTVRVTLRKLEKKGHVRHRRDGRRHVYVPVVPAERATQRALRNLVKTFFAGSPSHAILSMLDLSSSELSQAELDEIARWIEQERGETS